MKFLPASLLAVSLHLASSPLFGSATLESLSLEEKVGQLLMVHFNGESVNDDAKALFRDLKIGGVIYYGWANGLRSADQVRTLSSGLKTLADEGQQLPLLIAVDQEGGIVARLQHSCTIFPGNRALGETGDVTLASDVAFAMGNELRSVGITMNLAPVADINSNPKNPVIGIRSFGENPETVALFCEKALEGYRKAGIISTLKHFPGHGDVDIDSHADLPVLHKSLQELQKTDLLPFSRLAPRADVIMTSHILVPALDPVFCSTLSHKTISYLRQNMGFQGVVITDSLVMGAIIKRFPRLHEAAIQALKAGCDIVLLGGRAIDERSAHRELSVADIKDMQAALVNAIASGELPIERVNASVERILLLKRRLLTTDGSATYDASSHSALSDTVAQRALKVSGTLPSLHGEDILLVAPSAIQEDLERSSLKALGRSYQVCYFDTIRPSSIQIEEIKQAAEKSSTYILCSCNGWKYPAQISFLQSLFEVKKPTILIVTRDPIDADLLPAPQALLIPYGPTLPSLQAVAQILQQRDKNVDGIQLTWHVENNTL